MSWDLSSEEVICNKLESQQTVIFAFSKKIKELEAKNVELEKKLEISVACLRELRPVIELGEDWELGKWIDEALAAIKGASNE